MKNSNFVWTDLSTFDLDAAKGFYTKVFGWQFHDEHGYHLGYTGTKQSAALYTMPEKFQQMGLPSFWMSYIAVTDIDNVVAQAKPLGGIIEIAPTDFMGQGKIALIRDPSGAGFTVYEGPDLGGKDIESTQGRMAWNELYVSDVSLVLDFYQALFGWSFTADHSYDGERYDIHNGNGTPIAALEVIPNAIKGKDEFWVPYFAVQDLDATLMLIKREGGKSVDKSERGAGNLALAQDPQGATFALIEYHSVENHSVENDSAEKRSVPTHGTNQNNVYGINSGVGSGFIGRLKIRTFLALAIIYVAVLFDLQWMWGLLFLLWLIPDILSGHTHLAEPIRRTENPIWYWLIIGTWLWMSIYLLLMILD